MKPSRLNLINLGGLFDLEKKETDIQEYEEMMAETTFWDDQARAQEIIDQNNALKSVVNTYHEINHDIEDMMATYELLQEEYDEEMKNELEATVTDYDKKIDRFELQLLLDGEHDANNAIMELHPGAGGTESQDWTNMLLRMYNAFVNNKVSKLKLRITKQGMKQALKV